MNDKSLTDSRLIRKNSKSSSTSTHHLSIDNKHLLSLPNITMADAFGDVGNGVKKHAFEVPALELATMIVRGFSATKESTPVQRKAFEVINLIMNSPIDAAIYSSTAHADAATQIGENQSTKSVDAHPDSGSYEGLPTVTYANHAFAGLSEQLIDSYKKQIKDQRALINQLCQEQITRGHLKEQIYKLHKLLLVEQVAIEKLNSELLVCRAHAGFQVDKIIDLRKRIREEIASERNEMYMEQAAVLEKDAMTRMAQTDAWEINISDKLDQGIEASQRAEKFLERIQQLDDDIRKYEENMGNGQGSYSDDESSETSDHSSGSTFSEAATDSVDDDRASNQAYAEDEMSNSDNSMDQHNNNSTCEQGWGAVEEFDWGHHNNCWSCGINKKCDRHRPGWGNSSVTSCEYCGGDCVVMCSSWGVQVAAKASVSGATKGDDSGWGSASDANESFAYSAPPSDVDQDSVKPNYKPGDYVDGRKVVCIDAMGNAVMAWDSETEEDQEDEPKFFEGAELAANGLPKAFMHYIENYLVDIDYDSLEDCDEPFTYICSGPWKGLIILGPHVGKFAHGCKPPTEAQIVEGIASSTPRQPEDPFIGPIGKMTSDCIAHDDFEKQTFTHNGNAFEPVFFGGEELDGCGLPKAFGEYERQYPIEYDVNGSTWGDELGDDHFTYVANGPWEGLIINGPHRGKYSAGFMPPTEEVIRFYKDLEGKRPASPKAQDAWNDHCSDRFVDSQDAPEYDERPNSSIPDDQSWGVTPSQVLQPQNPTNEPHRFWTEDVDESGLPTQFKKFAEVYQTTFNTGHDSGDPFTYVKDGPWLGLIVSGKHRGKYAFGYEPPTDEVITVCRESIQERPWALDWDIQDIWYDQWVVDSVNKDLDQASTTSHDNHHGDQYRLQVQDREAEIDDLKHRLHCEKVEAVSQAKTLAAKEAEIQALMDELQQARTVLTTTAADRKSSQSSAFSFLDITPASSQQSDNSTPGWFVLNQHQREEAPAEEKAAEDGDDVWRDSITLASEMRDRLPSKSQETGNGTTHSSSWW